MQKWEYAEMIVTIGDDGLDELILFLDPKGTRVEHIEKDTNPALWDNFNKRIAQMGEDGWELVAPYTNNNPVQFLYLFKRPKG